MVEGKFSVQLRPKLNKKSYKYMSLKHYIILTGVKELLLEDGLV